MILPLQPIESQNNRQNNRSRRESPRKPTDVKIQKIMPRISLPGVKEGVLLASAEAPRVAIATSNPEEQGLQYCTRQQERDPQRVPSHFYPIGIIRCQSHSWINPLMQFMLFIPVLREIFSYTSTSFWPFNEFIDRYFCDMREKRAVSSAGCDQLISCLLGKFPQLFQKGKTFDLYEMIAMISHSAFASLDRSGLVDWHIFWDCREELSLTDIFERDTIPPELLIAARYHQSMADNILHKQYCSAQAAVCYDLDAFIEQRLDDGEAIDYYAYLKVDGTWVQCADARIVSLRRSTLVDLPLRRGILFHYRRVWAGQSFYTS